MPSTIFKGDKVATLKDSLQVGLNDSTSFRLITLSADPRDGAVDAPAGSIGSLNSTGEIFKKIDDGSTTNWELLGQGGSGGINYIENPDAETGTDGWSEYTNTTPAITPDSNVTASSSAADLELTQNTTAVFNVRGDSSFSLAHPSGSSGQGQGYKYAFEIDNADLNKNLHFSFSVTDASSFYSAGDLKVFVWDVDNDALITVETSNGLDGDIDKTGNNGVFSRMSGHFQATDSLNYLFLIHTVSTATQSYTVYAGDFRISPDSLVPGAIITGWEDFTPTGTWTSGVTYTGKYRRVGENAEVEIEITGTGTPSPSSLSVVNFLPSGLEVDFTKTAVAEAGLPLVGYTMISDATGSNYNISETRLLSSTTIRPTKTTVSGSNVVASTITDSNPIAFTTNDLIKIKATVPIVGWAASASLSTNQIGLQTVRAIYVGTASTANSSFADNTLEITDFDTKIEDTHNAVTTGASWVFTSPRTATYTVSATMRWLTNTNLNDSAMDLYVNGANVIRMYDDSNAVGNNGPITIYGTQSIKVNKGDTIQIRAAQDDSTNAARSINTSSNAYQRISIISEPDFSTFSVYGETSLLESYSNGLGSYSITAGDWGELTSIPLVPGEYDIDMIATFNSNGTTTTTTIEIGGSAVSGNTQPNAYEHFRSTMRNTSGQYESITVPIRGVVITTPTTYYLKAKASNSITNLQVDYKISARKIK